MDPSEGGGGGGLQVSLPGQTEAEAWCGVHELTLGERVRLDHVQECAHHVEQQADRPRLVIRHGFINSSRYRAKI